MSKATEKPREAPQIVQPDPDSQYRLLPCECGCTMAGYTRRVTTPPRRVEWAIRCPVCGRMSRYWTIKHHAQIEWNGRKRPSWDRD